MPRPKGSKNKAALTIDEQVAQVTAGIAALQEEVKKKFELKNVNDKKLMRIGSALWLQRWLAASWWMTLLP